MRAFEEEHHPEFLSFRLFGSRSKVSTVRVLTLSLSTLALSPSFSLSLPLSPSPLTPSWSYLNAYPFAGSAGMAPGAARY